MNNNTTPVLGGFPRIKINMNILTEKREQGFAQLSLKTIMKMPGKKTPLKIGGKKPQEITKFTKVSHINGVPLDVFAK